MGSPSDWSSDGRRIDSGVRQEREHTGASGVEPGLGTAVTERKYLLERVDDAAVVQVYADGFEKLPLKEKQLVWHLYQAALAGRDIYYDQRYVHNLEMRNVLEEILTHSEGIDAAVLAEIQRYTKLFWLNTGPYNNLTARKFVLKCAPEAFAAAAKTAVKNGATIAGAGGESLDAMLARLKPAFFDASVEPIVTNKTPGPGKDILTSSANNLYVGVTMKDLEHFEERYALNSRAREADRQAGRRGLQSRRQVRRTDPADRRPPRGGHSSCLRTDGQGASRARQVLSDRRDRRSRGVRHRVGRGQELAGGHDQRVHRSLHGSRAG